MGGAKARNPLLAARLAESGLTQEELGGAINAACEQLTGSRGTATDRYVRQLLDGTILWPRERYRRPLESIFGCTALDLGFVPPARQGRALTPQRPAPIQERTSVIRREFLRLAAGMTASVTLPELPAAARLTMGNVDELRGNLRTLHALDDRYGGGAVAAHAMRGADRIYASLESSRVSERVERALHAVAGTYSSTAGWFAYDAGDYVTAQHRFDRALRSALICRDAMLQAQTWNYMSLHAARTDRPVEALAIARAGLSSAASRQRPKVAALFHARVALRLAKQGERGMAERAIGLAFGALNRDHGGDEPSWLAFLDVGELTALNALVHLHLGQYESARNRGREALDLLSGSYARNRLYYTVQLAMAHLGMRQVEQACSTAHDALDLALETRSARSLDKLHEFGVRVAAWRVPEVRDWLERLQTVSRINQ